MKKFFTCILMFSLIGNIAFSQLSLDRIKDIADIKVERFKTILDLSAGQSNQLKTQTIKMLEAQTNVATSNDIVGQIRKNMDNYYQSLTLLKPQQLATLKLMDSMERESRLESYRDIMSAFDQSSDFGVAVATYNWNIAMPILVSYRKDLDRYISPADKATLAEIRGKLIIKYNFITNARESAPSEETEAIISTILSDLIEDINNSALPFLIQKYEERIVNVRQNLSVHEQKIKKDIEELFEDYVGNNYTNQIVKEKEFMAILGISKLMRDSFFLLMDGDSRANSFKVNTLHLMALGVAVNDQF